MIRDPREKNGCWRCQTERCQKLQSYAQCNIRKEEGTDFLGKRLSGIGFTIISGMTMRFQRVREEKCSARQIQRRKKNWGKTKRKNLRQWLGGVSGLKAAGLFKANQPIFSSLHRGIGSPHCPSMISICGWTITSPYHMHKLRLGCVLDIFTRNEILK